MPNNLQQNPNYSPGVEFDLVSWKKNYFKVQSYENNSAKLESFEPNKFYGKTIIYLTYSFHGKSIFVYCEDPSSHGGLVR